QQVAVWVEQRRHLLSPRLRRYRPHAGPPVSLLRHARCANGLIEALQVGDTQTTCEVVALWFEVVLAKELELKVAPAQHQPVLVAVELAEAEAAVERSGCTQVARGQVRHCAVGHAGQPSGPIVPAVCLSRSARVPSVSTGGANSARTSACSWWIAPISAASAAASPAGTRPRHSQRSCRRGASPSSPAPLRAARRIERA